MAFGESVKLKALALLKANGGNISKTARETGVNRATISAWMKGDGLQHTSVLEMLPLAEGALGDVFEKVARRYLARALDDEVVKDVAGQACVTSAAIAIDKMRLLRGEEAQQNSVTAIQFNIVQNILVQAGAINR